jgi:hypothetical protein
MNDTSQKSSEELAAELEKLMPKAKSAVYGWRSILYEFQAGANAKVLWPIAQLVLAQQQEIKQLKDELEELKNNK